MEYHAVWLRNLSGVYFKRGIQPKYGVQNEECGVQE